MSAPSVPLIIPPTSPLLSHPDVVILDASWLYEPPPHRDAHAEYLRGPRFPNARWWDLDAISEPHPDGYALMLPSPTRFAKFAGEHGITPDSHVVVYDGEGVFAAPRTAWTFKVYGHQRVSVIDGGLPRAIREGVALEEGEPRSWEPTTYPVPTVNSRAVVQFNEVEELAARSAVGDNGTYLIDARPTGAYTSGHIPTSLSLDFPTALLNDGAEHTYLRSPVDLKKHIGEQIGAERLEEILSGKQEVVNTCGGGLSAAINWLQFQSLGVDSRLYDESWGGWSARDHTVKTTGSEPI